MQLLFSKITSDIRTTYRKIITSEHIKELDPLYEDIKQLINSEFLIRASLLTRWLFTPSQEMLVENLIDGILENNDSIKREKILMVVGLMIFLLGFMLYTLFYGILRSIREYKTSIMLLSLLPIETITSVAAIRQFILAKVLT